MNLSMCLSLSLTVTSLAITLILNSSAASAAKLSGVGKELDCDKKLLEIDEAVANISIALAKNARPFTDVDDFSKNYCSPYPKWVKILLEYRACMKPFPRQILTMIGTSLRKGGKRFCSPEQKHIVVRHSKCFSNGTIAGIRLAMNKAIVAIENAVHKMPEKQLVPSLCCSYLEMVSQGTADIEKTCAPVSGPGTGKFLINGVITATGDGMELLCSQYLSLESCESKVPQIMGKVRKEITKNEPIYNFTPIVSLLNFVKKYDADVHLS